MVDHLHDSSGIEALQPAISVRQSALEQTNSLALFGGELFEAKPVGGSFEGRRWSRQRIHGSSTDGLRCCPAERDFDRCAI